MSSKKNEIAPVASVAITTSEALPAGFERVSLQRKWYKPREGRADFLVGVPLARSEDVSSVMPSIGGGPVHIWAIQLAEPFNDLRLGGEWGARGEVGEVVYMYEPAILASALRAASRAQVKGGSVSSVAIRAVTKVPIKNRKLNATVQAWQWELFAGPPPAHSAPIPLLALPVPSDTGVEEEAD